MKKIFLVMGIVFISLLASSCSGAIAGDIAIKDSNIVDSIIEDNTIEDSLMVDTLSTDESAEEDIIGKQDYAWTIKYNQYANYANWLSNTLIPNTILEYIKIFGGGEEFVKSTLESYSSLTVLDEDSFEVIEKTTESATNGIKFGKTDDAVLKNIEDTVTYIKLWNIMADYYISGRFKEDDYANSQAYHDGLVYYCIEMLDSYYVFEEYFQELVCISEIDEAFVLNESDYLTISAAYLVLINYRAMLQLFPDDDYWNDDFFAVSLADYENYFKYYLESLETLETYLNDEEQNKKEGLTSTQIDQLKELVNTASEMSIPYIEDIGKLLEAGSYDTELHDPNFRNNTKYNPVDTIRSLFNSMVKYYNEAIS